MKKVATDLLQRPSPPVVLVIESLDRPLDYHFKEGTLSDDPFMFVARLQNGVSGCLDVGYCVCIDHVSRNYRPTNR